MCFSESVHCTLSRFQQREVGKLTQARQHIETLYQKREAGYLKEQQDLEQFVQNAQSILEKAAREWNDLRVKALSALEQADQDQLLFRDLALAKERQRLQEHIARWNRDLEDLRKRDPEGLPIDGEKLLDRIQLVLDIAGFIPVLGAGPDAINTIISVGRGNWGDAAINAIAIIPFWGDAAKGGKMLAKAGREGVQHVDEISAAVNAVVKNADHADEAANVLIEGVEQLAKQVDEGIELGVDAQKWADDVPRELVDRILPESGFTDVVIHGTADGKSFAILSKGKWVYVNHRQLARWLIGRGVDGDIRLIACFSGAKKLAQNLANKLGVTVIAPNTAVTIWENGTVTGRIGGILRTFIPGIR